MLNAVYFHKNLFFFQEQSQMVVVSQLNLTQTLCTMAAGNLFVENFAEKSSMMARMMNIGANVGSNIVQCKGPPQLKGPKILASGRNFLDP